VLLPHVAAFNREHVAPAVAAEIDALDGLYEAVGAPSRFAAGELTAGDAGLMVAAALGNPFRDNNRRPAGPDDLRRLLAAAGAL